jgi:hypothetical protein
MPHADKPSAQEIANARRALHGVANPVGRWIIAQSSSASVLWLSNDRRSVANVLATRTVLACSIYYRLHRAEAPTLQALVDEKLVDAVPDDPFGSGPMRYDPKRRVTWSVGPDGKDTGGLDPPGRVANVGNYVWPTDGVFKR